MTQEKMIESIAVSMRRASSVSAVLKIQSMNTDSGLLP
jgi:hypothetical protein